jgi:hypothetical protein
VYAYPSRAALQAVKGKVRALTRGGTNQPLAALLAEINRVLGGWAHYFQHGVSKATFDYLRAFTWHRDRMVAPQAPSQLEVAPQAPPPRVVADGWQGRAIQPGLGGGHPLPVPGDAHPFAVVERARGIGREGRHRASARPYRRHRTEPATPLGRSNVCAAPLCRSVGPACSAPCCAPVVGRGRRSRSGRRPDRQG